MKPKSVSDFLSRTEPKSERYKKNSSNSKKGRGATTQKDQTKESKPVGSVGVPATSKAAQIDLLEPDRPIAFQPNPGPQTDFLSASEQEVLYGGAAGGGKSFALTVDPLQQVNNEHFRGLILRRTNDELRELKNVSQQLYPMLDNQAVWREKESTWYFRSGATMWMTYLDRDDDATRFQGQAFTWIGFDELTQWPTPYAWNYLRSRLRATTKSGLKLYQRGTTNPGGVGHSWVKKTFIDPSPPGKAFDAIDVETGEVLRHPEDSSHKHLRGKPLFQRRFIPAKLYDNPYLAEDGLYEANLLSLPEAQRKRLLEGNWDVAEGAAFTEWNRGLHVIDPYYLRPEWPRYRSCDYGYGSKSAVFWYCLLPNKQIVVYRELYTSGVTAEDLADEILKIEAQNGERISYGVLDSSLWHNRGDRGPSLAEKMIKRGCHWKPSDRSKGSRIAGKDELHRLLQVDRLTQEPRIVFFNTCTNIIAELPAIPLDKKNPDDVDTKADDHGYDALRYFIMSRPKPNSWRTKRTSLKTFQPADQIFGY